MNEYNLFLVSDSHGAYIADSPSKSQIFNFSNTSENYLDMLLKAQYLTSILSKNDTILFGRESAGVPEKVHKLINDRLKIPMNENTRSLNIASSVAIVLAESLRQSKLI